MAKNTAKKNRELVFAEESSEQPIVSNKKGRRVDYTKPDPKSGKLRPYGGTGEGNPSHANVPLEDRCTANRAKDGQRCTKLKIRGAEVCGTHGGRAPQVMRKAMARLQNSTDRLVQALLEIALDPERPDAVRLVALRDALDRAGVKSADKVDIMHSAKPYEALATKIMRAPSERVDEEYTARAVDMDDERY
ncbi:hypothetical protein [Actinomycetospora cinnamomea]|uniref:Uncharacterized protein n=1 Tax=Actinomycetospora cinnamomea TaxID=663609 RepID=A0A2U1FDC4_9PSEU|nr:hypothetical protein [Actinomycetospora cinnamomea]PVZ10158.1 hypothetical protein C8D89_105235 [Actinomycetospora cinnamomea]